MNCSVMRKALSLVMPRVRPQPPQRDTPAKLVGYVTAGHTIEIRPAPLERSWMEATGERFAYRCLPLNIANTHGWEILCPAGFTAIWSGGAGLDAVVLQADPGRALPASSHFGHGILTFHVPCLFQTTPGFDLMAQGPINRPKDAIAPLTGVVETDWSPYSFTMNWLFTRPGTAVRFEQGEPYCHIFPLRRGEVENVQPELRQLSDDPALERQHGTWTAGRNQFNAELRRPGSQAQADKWQKLYYQGIDMEGRAIAPDHRTRLRVKPFAR
jgi:Family of unknown function (DUF6065)